MHIELVTNLCTKSFLLCLKRLVSSRRKPKEIIIDCAKTFIGTGKEIKEMYKIAAYSEHNEEVAKYLNSEKNNWRFNPPSALHFRGLW